jgi:acetyl esterase/lipase
MRTAYETFLAQFEVPDGVAVRPVNAGGVSSLALAPGGEQDTAVLYLHGGGYTLGSAYGYRPLVGALVAAAGVGALVPDYRLAPEHPFPAALEDALSAYRWLAEQRGGARIVLAGDSVGGGLACSLLLTLRAQDLPLPAGAVLLCPGVDLSSESILSEAHDPKQLARLRRSTEAYLAGHPIDDPVVSPLLADLTGLPPLLVQAATGDFVLHESRLLVDRATAHGVDARLELYPADTHVFHVFWSFLPEAADAIQQAGSFISERLADELADRPERAGNGPAGA